MHLCVGPMYECMHVYTYVYVFYIYARTYANYAFVCVWMHAYIYMYAYVYVWMHTYMHMYVCTECTYVCMYIYYGINMCVYIYAIMHTYIYKYVQKCAHIIQYTYKHNYTFVGRDGAFVGSTTFNRRVVGSTPALAVT